MTGLDRGGAGVPARLGELLADWVTDGLADRDAHELHGLLAGAPAGEREGWELAAAAVDRAFAGAPREPLPERLRARVLTQARERMRAARESGATDGATVAGAPDGRAVSPGAPGAPRVDRAAARGRPVAVLGWLAAAAATVVAVAGWWPRDARWTPDRIARAPDAVRASFEAPQAELPGVTGEAVWSDALGDGFLLLRGLPVNDPAVAQYQIWIVDGRDDEPIDGGVFDAPAGPAGATLVVRIDAKLVPQGPRAIAVTREQPGGVVVSDQPLLAVARL